MEITLSRSWRAIVVRGIVALMFGLVLLLWPKVTLTELVLLFGTYTLVDGVLAMASGAHLDSREHVWLHWIEGFVGVGIALAVFFWTGVGTATLVDLIGTWAALTGILEVMMAFRLRRVVPGEMLLAFAGMASIVLGLLMLLWPMTGAFIIVVLLGCYALFFGTAILLLGMRMRRLAPDSESHTFRAPTGARGSAIQAPTRSS